MARGSDVKKAYLTRESQDEKRLKGLIALYDSALTACVESDLPTLEASLDVLQSKLNYDVWPGLGLVLYAQYNRCRELGREGNYLDAGRVLGTLRAAWLSGERRRQAEQKKAANIAGALRAKARFEALQS
jgi:hypothetical protein